MSAQEQWDWLHRGEITPVELVEHYLRRIERLDPGLGAFVTVSADRARRRAAELSAAGPTTAALWGLPIGDKDLYRRAGVRTTFGSRLFADFVPDVSDELVEVLDAAGTISLGTTNAPEFGFPSYTEPLAGSPARNPYDLELGAGGSSGGAAVAVAAGLLPFAPGSDGGGSIRIPAAATGLVGLKPSRGLVPAGTGFTSLAGLVTTGPIARSVADAAMMLDAMVAGARYEYATGAPRGAEGALLGSAIRGEGRYQLAVMTSSPWDDEYEIRLAAEARAALDLAVEELVALGHGMEETRLPATAGYAAAFRTVWQAGAASLPAEGQELELLEPLTRWLVERGRALTVRELGEALLVLTGYERVVIRALGAYDAVLTPALALTPRPLGWYSSDDPERNFAQQVQYTPFTSFVNVAGLPAIALPVAVTPDGLPMGVQLVGRPGGEATLLAIGAQLERRLGWARRHPPQW
nr:amidase [Galbitalea soli]